MDNIIDYKNLQQFKTIDEALEYNDKRVASVFKGFTSRKKTLLEFTNPSIENVERALRDANIYYVRERAFFDLCGSLFYADFFIPYFNLVIEIDGGYHETEKQRWIDRQKELFIADRGIPTVRLTNEEALNLRGFSVKKVLEKAEDFWKRVDMKWTDEYKSWRRRVYPHKSSQINTLKVDCSTLLAGLDLKLPIQFVNKKGEVLWEFSNIFYAHFYTGIKLKTIVGTLKKEKGFKRFIYKNLPDKK